MGATRLVAARQFLRDGLVDELLGDDTVTVTYAWDPESSDAKQIFTAPPLEADHVPAALTADRTKRNESGQFRVVVHIELPGEDQETADVMAVEYGQIVEEFIADKSPAVDGINWWIVDRLQHAGGLTGQSAISQLIYTIRFDARLT
jgi:hypothetical protein